MRKQDLELYTDYLISSFGATTATGLSAMVDGNVSHDHVTRFLSHNEFTSKDLWLHVKPVVREVEKTGAGVLIFDDTIQEKAWTDENEIMCWHYDHCSGRTVRGLNILNALYHCGDVSIPVAFEVIRKPTMFCDLKTRQVKRSSEATKNELLRDMFSSCVHNGLKFQFVLLDSWFASVDNFDFIRSKGKDFIGAMKDNRLVALTREDKLNGRYVRVDSLQLLDKQVVRGWLKGYESEILLVRRVFTNKDGVESLLNLVCSDISLSGDEVAALYKRRWKVEEFHKSLKSNAGLAKSPTRRVTTQRNHVFTAICAVFKLECLKIKHKANHFALRAKLLLTATQQAYFQLQKLQRA
jgi:DDE superfamily endonuclease